MAHRVVREKGLLDRLRIVVVALVADDALRQHQLGVAEGHWKDMFHAEGVRRLYPKKDASHLGLPAMESSATQAEFLDGLNRAVGPGMNVLIAGYRWRWRRISNYR